MRRDQKGPDWKWQMPFDPRKSLTKQALDQLHTLKARAAEKTPLQRLALAALTSDEIARRATTLGRRAYVIDVLGAFSLTSATCEAVGVGVRAVLKAAEIDAVSVTTNRDETVDLKSHGASPDTWARCARIFGIKADEALPPAAGPGRLARLYIRLRRRLSVPFGTDYPEGTKLDLSYVVPFVEGTVAATLQAEKRSEP